jgi:glutamyl-tRNA reductase
MSIFAFGVNHTTASVEMRERVAFAPDRLSAALRELRGTSGVNEAAIVSTCNRTDLYCELKDVPGTASDAVDWFNDYHHLQPREIIPYTYQHHSENAVRHLLRVASGLDSLVIGEPQILGQVKDAHKVARETGTMGRVLDRLFQHSFSVAKRVRTETAIGSSPVSVAYAAVSLAKQIFGNLSGYTAMLIGAGQTIELAARHLQSNGVGRMVIANRTVENARRLALQFDGCATSLSEIPSHLAAADIIITATGSQLPILTRAHADDAVRARRHRPMLIVDIAVPRDVEASVGDIDDIYLYTVDDLQEVIEENQRSRLKAAEQAEELIDSQVGELMGWLASQDVAGVIRAYRSSAERTRDAVLERALGMLKGDKAPEQALRFLANTLTNKLIHSPTTELRRAGATGDQGLVDSARALLGLPDEPTGSPPEDKPG